MSATQCQSQVSKLRLEQVVFGVLCNRFHARPQLAYFFDEWLRHISRSGHLNMRQIVDGNRRIGQKTMRVREDLYVDASEYDMQVVCTLALRAITVAVHGHD